MFVLGAIPGLIFGLVVDGSEAAKVAFVVGLFTLLGPLIFVEWMRMLERVFYRRNVLPAWRKFGLIE